MSIAHPDVEVGLIPISALQHYLFCPRQCALIHVEGLWAENALTAEGRLLHEKVDAGGFENRAGVRVARGLQIRSLRLGVVGRADAVEFRGEPPRPYPVEYKRGRPKPHRADEVQLCAQAMSLEEMFGFDLAEGALYYGAQRRRMVVAFDVELRAITVEVAQVARALIHGDATPSPVRIPGC
ncbi:MAG: CRISPR-associated protein Cas4, partial [Caulobacteraceae bacterium]|nr:CRISPR-associated protein Cas4 [Caulobacteraceae bacterium]